MTKLSERITIRVDWGLTKRLRRLADREGTQLSGIIRRALQGELSRTEGDRPTGPCSNDDPC